MKHIFKILATFLVVITLFPSCDLGGSANGTAIQLTFKDELGNTVSGASVKLYASETDWKNGTNQVATTQFSDEKGIVLFADLSAIKYYWFAEKDSKNNYNGAITTTSALAADETTELTVVLTSTGTLRFVNSSSDNYRVYVNGAVAGDMAGKATAYKYYAPIGSYSIRVVQLDGYIIYPTDKTYTGTLNAGNTLTTTFP